MDDVGTRGQYPVDDFCCRYTSCTEDIPQNDLYQFIRVLIHTYACTYKIDIIKTAWSIAHICALFIILTVPLNIIWRMYVIDGSVVLPWRNGSHQSCTSVRPCQHWQFINGEISIIIQDDSGRDRVKLIKKWNSFALVRLNRCYTTRKWWVGWPNFA